MNKIIELRNVKKAYKMGEVEVPAINGMSFSINRGEFLAIVGPSGSGKSTLLNLVGCLDIPTSGSIFLDGKNISKMSESKLAKVRGKKIGFVFQKFNLIQNLTSLENVMLPMVFQDVSDEERQNVAEKLMNKFGIGHRMHHKPSEMSGGEQQRIAISRALANDPDMILADEPTGNLDSKSGKVVLETLKNIHEDGKTVVLVTHDTSLLKYSERIIKIKDGLVEKEIRK